MASACGPAVPAVHGRRGSVAGLVVPSSGHGPVPDAAGHGLDAGGGVAVQLNHQRGAGVRGAGPLLERWDGKDWSLQSAATIDGGFPLLSSISCASNRFCFAVGTVFTGDYSNAAVFERCDGSALSFQGTGSGFPDGELGAVSCASRVVCMAAGADNTDGSPEVGRWDGRAWSGQTTGFYVNGLSCVSSNVCAFVGRPFQTTGPADICAIVDR